MCIRDRNDAVLQHYGHTVFLVEVMAAGGKVLFHCEHLSLIHISSARMSRYMHYTISEKKQSIWIAQREGRAKASNDRTQDSVVKMLAIGGEGDVIDRLM